MIPSDYQVYGQTRALLGEPSSGSRPANSTLHPFLDSAYQRLHRVMRNLGVKTVQRETVIGLYPYQDAIPLEPSELATSATGLLGFGYLEEVWERRGIPPTGGSFGIYSITPNIVIGAYPYVRVRTFSPHGWSSGDRVQIVGAVWPGCPEINGEWTISTLGLTDPNEFDIRGVSADASQTPAVFGYAARSTEQWIGPLTVVESRSELPTTPQSRVGAYCVQDRYLFVPPQSGGIYFDSLTLLKLVYSVASSVPAPHATFPFYLSFSDSLEYLAEATCAGFLSAKGTAASAAEHAAKAEAALRELLRGHVRQLQLDPPTVPPPFRGKRNIYPYAW